MYWLLAVAPFSSKKIGYNVLQINAVAASISDKQSGWKRKERYLNVATKQYPAISLYLFVLGSGDY